MTGLYYQNNKLEENVFIQETTLPQNSGMAPNVCFIYFSILFSPFRTQFIDCHRKNKYNIFKWRLNYYTIITLIIINARNTLRKRWLNYQEDFLVFQRKKRWFQAPTHSSEAPVTPRGMTSLLEAGTNHDLYIDI